MAALDCMFFLFFIYMFLTRLGVSLLTVTFLDSVVSGFFYVLGVTDTLNMLSWLSLTCYKF